MRYCFLWLCFLTAFASSARGEKIAITVTEPSGVERTDWPVTSGIPLAEGRSIETIEGVALAGELHPIQQKLLEHAALQCGICTPGIVVATKALLERNPNPTEEEARYWLAGNLCRCTGYDKIIHAVLDVAAVSTAAVDTAAVDTAAVDTAAGERLKQ